MTRRNQSIYVTRGGEKLAFALDHFSFCVEGLRCADLGSHVGGFVDCLVQQGAARVYSVDTAYGILAWKLRKNDHVVVMERTNAMHVQLPERVDLVTVDAGWTTQSHILPHVATLLKPHARVITLIKPHYEASRDLLQEGVLPDDLVDEVLSDVMNAIQSLGWGILNTVFSPLRGHAGNRECFALLAYTSHEKH